MAHKGNELTIKADKTVSIADCLTQFKTPEKLSAEDVWRCPACKHFVEATKQIELYRVPPILIVSLNRFKHQNLAKVTDMVRCPEAGVLDLTDFIISKDEKCIYDLIGVVNHYEAVHGGHYKANVKNHE